MDEIKGLIKAAVDLLPVEKAVSEREAERRAGHFLLVQAYITDAIDTLSDDKIKGTSLVAAIYASLMAADGAKNVTEKKSNAEAHPDYTTAREAFERAEDNIKFLKTYYEIFGNAHVFYRQLAKGVFNG